MTSNGRILKSNQLENHEIVLLGRAPAPEPNNAMTDGEVEEALLFTASEVEDLCEKARASGAADAAATLGPAIEQMASAMATFVHDHEIATAREQQLHSHAVIDTAASIARWVLGRELSEPNALLDVIARAMNEPVGSRPCKIRVHGDLVPLLYDITPPGVELLTDQALELGEFRIEHEGPEIALRFETTLARAKDALQAPLDEQGSDQ